MRANHSASLLISTFVLVSLGGCSCGETLPIDDASVDGGARADTGPGTDSGPVTVCGDTRIEGSETCDDGNQMGNDGCSATCRIECGDGVLNTNENCDTGIGQGSLGACPAACDDLDACTTDSMQGTGCQLECVHTLLPAAANGDGCCLPGDLFAEDNDCPCGDGNLDSGETCDIGITGAAGECPSVCADTSACATETLINAGTCTASCQFSSDTCDPVGFRFTDLDLMDPHIFISLNGGCIDGTNIEIPFLDVYGINPLLEQAIQEDGADADNFLDLNMVLAFTPLTQAAATTTNSDLVFPDCTDPIDTTMCTLAADATHTAAPATNQGAGQVCVGIIPGTVNPYNPAVTEPTAPGGGSCFMASAGTVSLSLGGIPITLQDAHIGGVWSGDPATAIEDGLIRGFISEADAAATIIPEGLSGRPEIDGQSLASLFPGGPGNCDAAAPRIGDRDTYTPPGGAPISGWYLYLNFSAVEVPYTEL